MTSTPNPTHIIAEHHAEHGEAGSQQIPGCCCGWQGEALEHPPWNPIPGVADALHAAHVVSKLTDAGYSIVKLPKPDNGKTWEIEAFTVFTDSGDEGVHIVPITDPDPSVGQYDVNEFIARSTGSDEMPDPVPGFTPPICSWCSRPIHGDAEGEASTGRVHHARDECPSPPGWPERG